MTTLTVAWWIDLRFKWCTDKVDVHIGGLADEVRDLFGELVGAADHHAMQSSRVLGDVDHDSAHFEDGCIIGL